MNRFNIGDQVWVAWAGIERVPIQCPSCFGKRVVRVIFGDDSVVGIDCPECGPGIQSPSGVIYNNVRHALSRMESITRISRKIGIVIGTETVEYSFASCHYAEEKNIFSTRQEAEDRAAELAVILQEEEEENMKRKECPAKSWAWNASYHRGEIRRKEKEIEYHRSKLLAASPHVKAEKELQ